MLPIGGLKEAFGCSKRGTKKVLIPFENSDLKEVPNAVAQGLEIILVRWIDEVFPL